MKTETHYSNRLASLLSKIKSQFPVQAVPERKPVDQLVMSFLQWEATVKQAEEAYERLRAVMVDDNELRVTHPHEVMEILGARYPKVEERCQRMRQVLQAIYRRQRAVTLEFLASLPKKQVRAALDSLPGMPPYVAAQMTLLCYKGHAVPVDSVLAGLLIEAGAADSGATVESIESMLERRVKASEALEVHLQLQAWADANRGGAGTSGRTGRSGGDRSIKKAAAETAKKRTVESKAKPSNNGSKKKSAR